MTGLEHIYYCIIVFFRLGVDNLYYCIIIVFSRPGLEHFLPPYFEIPDPPLDLPVGVSLESSEEEGLLFLYYSSFLFYHSSSSYCYIIITTNPLKMMTIGKRKESNIEGRL